MRQRSAAVSTKSSLSLPDDLEDADVRDARGRGDLAQTRAASASLANRCAPVRFRLRPTCRRPSNRCQGISHLLR